MFLSQHRLRQILGVIWIIDGLLQLQPQMFTMNMINGVMVPLTNGQPGLIARNLHWITQITTHNLTLVNIIITVVQVSIGVLLFTGVYVRQAVIASAVWALIVWYGGEGMSLLLTGQASILTGAPGAVLLYPLIGLVVYPRDDSSNHLTARDYPGLISRRQLRLAFGGLWIFLALLQLQPYWWDHAQISQAILSMVGMGGWDNSFIDPTLRTLATHLAGAEVLLNLVLIAVCLGIGAGLLLTDDRAAAPVLMTAALVSFIVWWFAEAFGGILTGMSTDFNSGLLLIVIAFACMPGGAGVRQASLRTRSASRV